MNDPSIAEDPQYPVASPETTRFSGIPDTVTRSAVGKLHTLLLGSNSSNSLRHDLRTLCLLTKVAETIPTTAKLYRERNGKGAEFHRLKWNLPARPGGQRRQKTLHLGRDLGLASWANDILIERHYLAAAHEIAVVPTEKLHVFRQLLKRLKPIARRTARAAGFVFHGSRLVERRYL